MKVLFVQQQVEPQVLKMLAKKLPVNEVFVADSLVQAQSLLALHRLQVAIVDMDLLRKDGLGLVRRLRLAHPLIKIIGLSAPNDLAMRVALYEHDADVSLAKPVAPAELVALVTSAARASGGCSAWQTCDLPARVPDTSTRQR